MLDLKKMETTLALLAGETAQLARPSKWQPGAIIATAASAGAILAVAVMAAVICVLKLIQG